MPGRKTAHAKQAFDERAEHLGQSFAIPAAIAVQNAQVLAQTQRLTAKLQSTLTHGAVIDQAIGILMSRSGVSADQARPGDKIVWYAGRPGAFVDFAADLEQAPGPDGGVVLDGDLPVMPGPPREPGITGLAELSVINPAIGVLITRGHTPDQAKAELRRRAAVSMTSVTEVARHVLASTNAPPPHPVLAVTSEPCGPLMKPMPLWVTAMPNERHAGRE